MSSVNNSLNTPFPVGGGSSGYPTQYAILTGNGTNALNATALTDGQLLIGNSSGAPAAAHLSPGTGISITNAAGSITINNTTSVTWSTTTGGGDGDFQQMVTNNGYICNFPMAGNMQLPTTSALGDILYIIGGGISNYAVTINDGQSIQLGTQVASSEGIVANNSHACVTLICTSANTAWAVVSSINANWAVV